MNTTCIKKVLGFTIFLIGAVAFAQDNVKNNKLAVNSFSLTPLEVFFTDNSGGIAITGELGYKFNKNIVSFSGSIGEEYSLFVRGYRFQQLNLMYGREFEIANRFFIDTHCGLGMFRFKDEHFTDVTLGIPIVCKLRYRTGEKFSIGLKFKSNFNSVEKINNIYSIGLLLQWNY